MGLPAEASGEGTVRLSGMTALEVREADLDDPGDAAGLVEVLDSYAADPVGIGRPLGTEVRDRLVPMLRQHPTTLALLALEDGRPVGLAICFWGLSSFHARPLLNIHDLAVLPGHRGRGAGRALLAEIERRARERGCCRLTLEVQEDNQAAMALYRRLGFGDGVLGEARPTRFLTKSL